VKVRGRLVLAFGYILITVIVALTVPLAFNLRQRTIDEIESQAKLTAQTIAAGIGAEMLHSPRRLDRLVDQYAAQTGDRVIVTDADGIVLADSDGEDVGQDYANGLRPELTSALDPAAPTADALIRFSRTAGADILVAAAPILDEGLVGAVRITQNVQDVTDAVRSTTIGLIAVGLAGLLAGLVIAFALAGSLSRPLTRLAATAHRLGRGDLQARVGDVGGASEIEDLAHSFDEMADRVERSVVAQREFVANASHQLRTPLTGMKLRLEAASADAPPDVRRQLDAADDEVDRLAAIVDRLLVNARRIEAGDRAAEADLARVAGRALERWRDRAATASCALELEAGSAVAMADPTDVDQIVDNLLENAIRYAPGPIVIGSGVHEARAAVWVRDHGPGIPAPDRERVTERFYRGAGAPEGGSGLGLAIARDLAESNGGALEVRGAEDGGTIAEVRFRLADAPPREPSDGNGAAHAPADRSRATP
jgi:signal transduction histidine kinase